MAEKIMSPTELFTDLKQKKSKETHDDLFRFYANALILAEKCVKTGQKRAARKLQFYINNYEREKKLLDVGIDTYVYRSDIEYYIDNLSTDRVSITELENYPREIPDEIVDIICKYKDLFDRLYIVFTDYTEQLDKEIEKERIETDPILFGAFMDNQTHTLAERFYYLGDWEDEYCNLTLDRMINEINEETNAKIDHLISSPDDLKKLKEEVNALKEADKENSTSVVNATFTTGINNYSTTYLNPDFPTKKPILKRILTFFSRKH